MRLIDLLCAIIVVSVFGGGFIAGKIAMQELNPMFFMGVRLGISALILLPFVPKPEISWLRLFFITMTYTIFHNGPFFYAVSTKISVSAVIVGAQLAVPFSTILGIIFLNEKPSLKQALGILISFTGIVIIFGSPHIKDNLSSFMLVILGALSFAISNIQIKKAGKFNVLSLLAYSSLIASPIYFILSYFLDDYKTHPLDHMPAMSTMLAMLYAIFGSTLIGFGLWFRLLQQYPVHLVMPFSLLTPLVGVAAAVLILGDSMHHHIMLGGTLIVSGVGLILINLSKFQGKTA